MRFSRTVNVVGVHAAGEVGDVIVGGVLDVPGASMYEKMMYFWNNADHIRNLLMNEPRGRISMSTNLIIPPCNPTADAGFLIMGSDEYNPMSGSNTMCVVTVLLETGMLQMVEPITRLSLDTAAGLITATAECTNGKCKSVAVNNVPAFAYALDFEVDVPGIGKVSLDIAWGGMFYCIIDAAKVDLKIESANGAALIEVGERIKQAAKAAVTPIHPENPSIRGINNIVLAGPLERTLNSGIRSKSATIIKPGRVDRSPCGTGTSARMAVLHARGLLKQGKEFHHQSAIGTEFVGHIRGVEKVGSYDAVLPTIKGSAWITSFKQVVLDPTDPFPEGFRVGDSWPTSPKSNL